MKRVQTFGFLALMLLLACAGDSGSLTGRLNGEWTLSSAPLLPSWEWYLRTDSVLVLREASDLDEDRFLLALRNDSCLRTSDADFTALYYSGHDTLVWRFVNQGLDKYVFIILSTKSCSVVFEHNYGFSNEKDVYEFTR